jgi:serine/alanine adding enzyme
MAAGFKILAATGADASAWRALIERLPANRRDIHFLPEYALIYAATHGVVPRLAVFESEYGFVIQPFIVRNLDELPFLKEQDVSGNFQDISNTYGYGGPLHGCGSHVAAEGLLAAFERELLAYCDAEGYASEFCALHPLMDVAEDLKRTGTIKISPEKEIVYMDLAAGDSDIWRGVRKGHKSSITRARRNNVKVERVEGNAENLQAFKTLYYETMARNKAAERWFFPQSYFCNCLEILGEARASLHFATVDGDLAVAAMLIHDFGIAYYHFAGSDPRFNASSAGNLLVYESALWAKRAGYRYFHLGGGVGAGTDDNLFVFKSGFSELRATLYTYGRTLQQSNYLQLCELKVRHEIATGWNGNTGYFPMYRR